MAEDVRPPEENSDDVKENLTEQAAEPTENNKLSELQRSNDIYMQSSITDQLNSNQQSNMTFCSCSLITQSSSTVKINIAQESEVD